MDGEKGAQPWLKFDDLDEGKEGAGIDVDAQS